MGSDVSQARTPQEVGTGSMVIIVMGVSGSGKTAVGEALAKQLHWQFEDADHWHPASNIQKMHSGAALTDADRNPWLRALNAAIRSWIAKQLDVVLACSALRNSHRAALREGIPELESVRFVYLKGTYEQIDARLRARVGHFMPESLLKSQFATLQEPDAADALVVDINHTVPAIVDFVVSRLGLGTPSKSTTGRDL